MSIIQNETEYIVGGSRKWTEGRKALVKIKANLHSWIMNMESFWKAFKLK